VRKVTVSTGIISKLAGAAYGYGGDGGPATDALTAGVAGLALDGAGKFILTDSLNNAVRKVDATSHLISTIARTTGNPKGLVFDGSGNLYVADNNSQVVRRLGTNGRFVVVAGTGVVGGYGGEGGPAVNASIGPLVPAVDTAGTLYFSDQSLRILKVNLGTGIINAFAGNGDPAGVGGDGGPALSAQLTKPRAVATDSKGQRISNRCGRLSFGAWSQHECDYNLRGSSRWFLRRWGPSNSSIPVLSWRNRVR